MSTWFQEAVLCGGCGHELPALLARGIHAPRVPEVRARLLRGELHRFTCSACSAVIDVQHDLVYTDFPARQWVRVAKPADLATWREVERGALAQVDRVMQHGAPVVAELADGLRMRVVFDLDELRERLVLWDAGLDDAVVECVKLSCLRERPDLARPGHRVRVRGIDDGALALASVPAHTPAADAARWTASREVVDRVQRARADWQHELPELFDRGFVSLDRYLLA